MLFRFAENATTNAIMDNRELMAAITRCALHAMEQREKRLRSLDGPGAVRNHLGDGGAHRLATSVPVRTAPGPLREEDQ